MIVYSRHITARLQYITDFFANEMSETTWKLTTDMSEFIAFQGIKINYSDDVIDCDCINIHPHELLFEVGIRSMKIVCTIRNGFPIFFQNESKIGFDIFAASFYLLSRYEEYLPNQKDKYERYDHQNSLAFKENFLHRPLINIWIEDLKKIIAEKNITYKPKKKQFIFLPTYDIDMARSFVGKGFARNTANFVKEFFTFRFADFFARYKTLCGMKKDPFDTFDRMNELHQIHQLHPRYFFLVAEKRSEKDKNISPFHPIMRKLIQDTEKQYDVGLHPSWRSNENEKILKTEKEILEKIAGKTITASRQHYLKFTFPETCKRLLQCGITSDFTMGYAGENGFRASAASPFAWYDLEKETATELIFYPFCFMESASIFYKKQSPEQTLAELQTLYHEVKNVNGFFSMIWHNSSLSDINEYKGWRKMYELFIKTVCGLPLL
jgi:hypothetical protein